MQTWHFTSLRMYLTMYHTMWTLYVLILSCAVPGIHPQSWWPSDSFDSIREKMESVTSMNCHCLTDSNLQLPIDTLPQLPRYSQSYQQRHQNRTLLWRAHALALSRGIANTFTNSRLNRTADFQYQTGLMYHYMSTSADVAANAGNITGSGIFYDTNTMYANWYSMLPFNVTLTLFGPRAFDNQTDIFNNDIDVNDFGAGGDSNYTSDSPDYPNNPWFNLFLPDDTPELDIVRKWSYDKQLKYNASDVWNSHVMFYAALPTPEEPSEYEPVLFTSPYFDCGRSNKWIASAVAPIVDHLPRYLDWYHLRRMKFVAEAVIDVDFINVDLNQCPLSLGNPAPNEFAGTARCKPATTNCSPIPGFGFQRGGYECSCLPGYVYPPGQNGPFQGTDIENATQTEYMDGFDCLSVRDFKERIKSSTMGKRKDQDQSPIERKNSKRKFVPRYRRKVINEQPHFDFRARIAVDNLLSQMHDHKFDKRIKYSEEMAYGGPEQFGEQALLAVKLANFLSNFLQDLRMSQSKDDPREDKPIHKDAIIGEIIGNVMADVNIFASGVFFDEGKYVDPTNETNQFYGPYTYRTTSTTCHESSARKLNDLKVRDRSSDEFPYTEEPWFLTLKDRWSASIEGLQYFQQRSVIRSDIEGSAHKNFRRYPTTYYAASFEDGIWSSPYCPCDGEVNQSIITFAVPFFGPSNSGLSVEFRGVVTVDFQFVNLDVNQCFQPFWIGNFFKNTAMCDYNTTVCNQIKGRALKLGSYECECKAGYYSPPGFSGPFTSRQVEEAYLKGQALQCIPYE